MITSDISIIGFYFLERFMINIFKYLDKKTKYLTIIGALANGVSH